ncbi:hypothetical protein BH09SUM1_BH09SUM1_07680 [soil metagenome]
MAEGRFSKLESTPSREPMKPPPGTIPRDSRPGDLAANAGSHAVPENEGGYAGFLLQADEAFYLGDYRTSLRHYSRALQLENSQVYPWIGQISSLIELKQYKEAELWSNRALEQFPEDGSLLSQRGRVLALTGNLKRAIGVSDYATQKGGTEWSWLARGEILLEANDSNALFCFEKAAEIAGKEDWRIPALAARAYMRRRQWANAEQFLLRAIQLNGHNFFIWFQLAQVLLELNFTDRCRDALSRVMQLKPDFRPARELEMRLYRRPFFKRVMGVFKR